MANFVRHTSCEDCGSSDGKAVYDDESTFCFVCQTPHGSNNKQKGKMNKSSDTQFHVKESKPALTQEEKDKVKENTESDGYGFRGIDDDINRYFGVRYLVTEDNEVIKQYCPVTQDGQLVGYKVREAPKDFYSEGRTGAECELFMQFRFSRGGKYVLITEGEIDSLSAYQMLKRYNESRGSEFEIACVSPTTGAMSHKQIAGQYSFFDKFDNIILCYDNDKAGRDASERVIPVLPKGKVKLMQMQRKDANEYLLANDSKNFIREFYNARPYVPAGVISSSDLYEKIIEQAGLEKVTFPPFLKKLEVMLGGGLILGHIYNIAAMTSIGKTSIVNELIYHWIFHSPHYIGVVSMELNSGQYGEAMLSRHIQSKIARLSPEDKIKSLQSEDMRSKGRDVFSKEDGSPRFYLVDDRDGTVDQLKEVIEQMVVGSGVKIVVIDPLQDLIEGMSNEDQALFMKWCKSMIKSHNISFVLINHMRKKGGGDNDIRVSESDIMGSSTIMKSASANILLARDKEAEDEVERNTTYVTLPKNRVFGDTGPAGKIYYDRMTHVMHDYDEYWGSHNKPL